MFYRIDAEHVRDKKGLVLALAKERIEVMMSGVDPTFESMFVIVLVGDRKDADLAQHIVWEHNGGAYAGITELTEDQYDDLL